MTKKRLRLRRGNQPHLSHSIAFLGHVCSRGINRPLWETLRRSAAAAELAAGRALFRAVALLR